MYQVKKIIKHDEEIPLPKCMYTLRKIYTFDEPTEIRVEISLNIDKQVKKFLQRPAREMADLEKRQDQLLVKLDLLYDKIMSISKVCQVHQSEDMDIQEASKVQVPDEIVLSASLDNLPWFVVILNNLTSQVNFKWHIHSSVPKEMVAKVNSLVKELRSSDDCRITLRLIFKCVSADSELKLSSLAVPIVGNVNILRYLSLVYPSAIPYNDSDYVVDGLLDLCHILERSTEKNKEAVLKNIFAQYSNGFIYKGSLSIVDIAAYNVIKQWRNCPTFVPKEWFDKIKF